MNYETFFDPGNETAQSFLLGYKPYLLKNAMTSWDLSAFTSKGLASHFPDSRVDYYPHNMREESVRPFFTNLADALENFDNPTGTYSGVDASDRSSYIQWNMKHGEWEKFKGEFSLFASACLTQKQWLVF